MTTTKKKVTKKVETPTNASSITDQHVLTYEGACREVYDTLSKINVNDHTEDKNGFTYLTWAWAHITIMKVFPSFDYSFRDNEFHPDGTVTVWCDAWVMLYGFKIQKTMWLPVMNYNNKAIPNPTSVDMNTARMRCLTKAISMLGLGTYIYAGEDLPQEAPAPVAQPSNVTPMPAPQAQAQVGSVVADSPAGDELYIEGPEAAAETTTLLITLAQEMHAGSLDALRDFWMKNRKVIDLLDTNFNSEYQRLKEAFTKLRTSLEAQQ